MGDNSNLVKPLTRIKPKFGRAGLFVWHCHIVEHEDNEMMRPYFVRPRLLTRDAATPEAVRQLPASFGFPFCFERGYLPGSGWRGYSMGSDTPRQLRVMPLPNPPSCSPARV